MVYWGTRTIAIPPGETIKEQLESWNVPQETFVAKMGMTAEQIESLLEGDAPVTEELAKRMSPLVRMPARVLVGMEDDYRADLAKVSLELAAKAKLA